MSNTYNLDLSEGFWDISNQWGFFIKEKCIYLFIGDIYLCVCVYVCVLFSRILCSKFYGILMNFSMKKAVVLFVCLFVFIFLYIVWKENQSKISLNPKNKDDHV